MAEQEKIWEDHEIKEMFDKNFLPMLWTLMRRFKEKEYKNEELVGMMASIQVATYDFDKDYTFQELCDKCSILFQITPYEKKKEEELADEVSI